MSNFTHEIINNILAKMWLFGVNWVFSRYYDLFFERMCFVLLLYIPIGIPTCNVGTTKLQIKFTRSIYQDIQSYQRHPLPLH